MFLIPIRFVCRSQLILICCTNFINFFQKFKMENADPLSPIYESLILQNKDVDGKCQQINNNNVIGKGQSKSGKRKNNRKTSNLNDKKHKSTLQSSPSPHQDPSTVAKKGIIIKCKKILFIKYFNITKLHKLRGSFLHRNKN